MFLIDHPESGDALAIAPVVTPATIERVGTHVAYENPFIRVDLDDVVFPNGARGSYSRVTLGTGLGVVAVPYANFRGIPYLGFVEQHRYPIDEVTLEFPRGGSDDLSLSEAARELVEETGLTYQSGHLLGFIRPDTGILTTKVAVWQTSHLLQSIESRHVEDETGCRLRWYSHGEVLGLIRNGRISCGITLAAFALLAPTNALAAA
ncbi:NUDIX hydrolase [Arthrobacter sp. A2-55]|uniref:NUDIX hydrolase n=1 Tax=Arthrobacter sp. A2-55 TaxID=2897337 RepID=UPI0021CD9121|nr:NUDIX hydrolase [Arthrobacter sp. A2-55]MCU6479014.1 NUDIX hydrolase [Arthrobacter sp. A2-55]